MRWRIGCLLLVILLAAGARAEEWPDRLLREMTLEEKVCQLFFVRPEDFSRLSRVTGPSAQLERAFERFPVGGVVLFERNMKSASQLAELNAAMQACAQKKRGIGLLIGVDEEGGSVARVSRSLGLEVPSNTEGALIGSRLREAGFTLDFAPVADIRTEVENAEMTTRCYGSDAAEVSCRTAEFVKAIQAEGVLAVLKHFPGHGSVSGNSHTGRAVSVRTVEQWREEEWIPFQEGIRAGAGVVMISHQTAEAVDASGPASLSRHIVTDLLRGELGFDGVVITDALRMRAIADRYGSGETCVRALEAGCDMLLLPANFTNAYNGVMQAIQTGRLSEERIDESVRRILVLKRKCGLLPMEADEEFLVGLFFFEKIRTHVLFLCYNTLNLLWEGEERMERVIYHIDCNSFFASVECMERPELNGVPMAVAGDAENRHGIILAKNEMARGFGVKTAETIYQARRKCPQLVLVPPHGRRYAEVSRQVKRLFYEYTDQVESFGMDEAWLDVTGSLRYFQSTPVQLADAIRQRVKREIGITVSVGVSFNKAFAKLGSDMKKPDGTTLISRENFHRRVWPLPADELLFVGKNAGEKLKRHCIDTIGDIARCEPAFLEQLLGKGGDMLWRYANGYDDAPVRRMGEREPPKSIGNGMTFRRDLLGWDEVKRGILALTDEVASRLRESGVKCSRLQMMIRDPSLKSITRQCSLTRPTHLQKELVDAAMRLMRAHWQENAPVRALAVTALGLCRDEEAAEQLVWNHPDEQQLNRLENAESAMWKLREKYGSHCLAMGYVESEELGIRPFHREARQPSFTHDE